MGLSDRACGGPGCRRGCFSGAAGSRLHRYRSEVWGCVWILAISLEGAGMVMGGEFLGNIDLPEYQALNAGRIQLSPSTHSRRQDRGCARSTHVEGETLRRGGTIIDRIVDKQQADHARQENSTMLLAASFPSLSRTRTGTGWGQAHGKRDPSPQSAGTARQVQQTSRRKRGVQRKDTNSPGHQRDRPCTCALAEGQGRFGPWRSWSDRVCPQVLLFWEDAVTGDR
jgi:hypothetical protein